MSMTEWAENEVKLACQKEAPDRKEDEWDYGCACYESALKVYKLLAEEGHSGYSWECTRQILNRLMEGKPLTPIEDTPDVWIDHSAYFADSPLRIYQCKRMSSLFKYVHPDGEITYTDNNRIYTSYAGRFAAKIIDEKYPITMPYFANENYHVVVDVIEGVAGAILELYINYVPVKDFTALYYDLRGKEPVSISMETFYALKATVKGRDIVKHSDKVKHDKAIENVFSAANDFNSTMNEIVAIPDDELTLDDLNHIAFCLNRLNKELKRITDNHLISGNQKVRRT